MSYIVFNLIKTYGLSIALQSQTIEQKLNDWKDGIQAILNVATAIFAIVGGFLIFFQYMQGNDQAQKNFIKFIIGLAIVGLVNLIAGFFLTPSTTT